MRPAHVDRDEAEPAAMVKQPAVPQGWSKTLRPWGGSGKEWPVAA